MKICKKLVKSQVKFVKSRRFFTKIGIFFVKSVLNENAKLVKIAYHFLQLLNEICKNFLQIFNSFFVKIQDTFYKFLS